MWSECYCFFNGISNLAQIFPIQLLQIWVSRAWKYHFFRGCTIYLEVRSWSSGLAWASNTDCWDHCSKLVAKLLVARHWKRSFVSWFLFKLAFCCTKLKFWDQDEDSPEFTQFPNFLHGIIHLMFWSNVEVSSCWCCVVVSWWWVLVKRVVSCIFLTMQGGGALWSPVEEHWTAPITKLCNTVTS